MKEARKLVFLYGGGWLNSHLSLPQNELRLVSALKHIIKKLRQKLSR